MVEEAAVRKKADEVRAKREEIEMSRGVTIEDLTKGLLNYKYTGLSFVQGEKGALMYVCFILFESLNVYILSEADNIVLIAYITWFIGPLSFFAFIS